MKGISTDPGAYNPATTFTKSSAPNYRIGSETRKMFDDKKSDSDPSTVVVDALPYIDLGYDEPGVREAALALVEEETRRYRPTKNYLEQVSLAVP